MNVKYRSNCIN